MAEAPDLNVGNLVGTGRSPMHFGRRHPATSGHRGLTKNEPPTAGFKVRRHRPATVRGGACSKAVAQGLAALVGIGGRPYVRRSSDRTG